MEGRYGEAPGVLGTIDLPLWQEFMHYLYLPVRIPRSDTGMGGGDSPLRALPPQLEFLQGAIKDAIVDAYATTDHLLDPYVYVSARRGYATPGDPLNRPGWHCDDFGGTDLNYIWSDRFPTRLLLSTDPLPIPEEDTLAMTVMTRYAAREQNATPHCRIEDAPCGRLLRLTPFVVHHTPIVPEPGGMRSFFKISVSTHRYNLIGNSHNHLLDYDWPMYDRTVVRNQPAGKNLDYVEV